MSKQTKIWLMIGVSLVLVGCLVFGSVMTMLKWDFSKLGTGKYETNTYEITEEFYDISIKTDTADILFTPADDNTCKVVCYEKESEPHAVSTQNGTLIVQAANEKAWYDHIGITIDTPKITVYLPEAAYGLLSIEESTGDIAIPNQFVFDGMDITTSTGDVKNEASVGGWLKIKTSTGHICVENASADTLDLSVSTGNVKAENVTCPGEMIVHVDTGKAKLTNVQCGKLTSTGDTGDLTMTNVTAAETFAIERSTGDITFDGCDAGEIFVKTSTGDVTGGLRSDKIFFAMTSTGKVNVPKSITGGRCEITTDTGDIEITVG